MTTCESWVALTATAGTPDDGTVTVTVDELAECYALVDVSEGAVQSPLR